MFRPLLIFCLAALPLTGFAYEQRDLLQQAGKRAGLEQSLVRDDSWVPYPAYRDRQGWETLLGDAKEEIIRKGERFLDYEWKVVKATDYMEFQKSGNRDVMQKPYNDNTRALCNLFMAEMAEGKGRFMNQVINGSYCLCEMTSWALSAHLVVQHSKSSLPDVHDQIIDLGSGTTGAMLAWIHYFLHAEFDKANPLISQRIETEIERKILTPFYNETRFWWMALPRKEGREPFVNNWNPWCNSSVLQCVLLMEKDAGKKLAAVQKGTESVDQFLNYVKEDGACEEGPAYWGHAAGKLYDYLELLHKATKGKVTVFEQPMVRAMGEYISRSYVGGDDWVVNFADASAKERLDFPMIYRYGKATGSREMMEFAAWLHERSKGAVSVNSDIFRVLESLRCRSGIAKIKPAHTHPAATWYPDTQFCYMSNKNCFFAAKGGHNNESHNHNDVGTFSFYVSDSPVFVDVGVGTYTRQTFSSERYSIWTMQSDYHNVPRINGFTQKHGAAFKAERSAFDERKRRFSLDIAKAYPAEAGIEEWTRSYTLGDKTLVIEDAFKIGKAEKPNQIHFLIRGNTDASKPGTLTIETDGSKVTLAYDARAFDLVLEPVQMKDQRLERIWKDGLTRVTLTAKRPAASGRYRYTVTF